MPDPTDSSSSEPADPYEELDEPQKAHFQNERFVGDEQLCGVLAGDPALAPGAHGKGVKRVQQAMIDMGFSLPGAADGSYGRQTSKAVRNFQVNASKAYPEVTPTGDVDAATLRALDELAPPPGHQGQTKNVPIGAFEGKKVRVVVLKDEHRTFLFDRHGKLDKIFLNAVGKDATPTTEGLKFVASKLDEPAAIEVGMQKWGAPVFGARIVDLSWANGKLSGEELHGTVSPGELGEDVSHGCVRHSNPDIITIYDSLISGEKVAIVSGLGDPRLRA